MNRLNRTINKISLSAAGLLLAMNASAVTISLTNAGGNGGNYGNSLAFSTGGLTTSVYGFGETGAETPIGSSYYQFQSAEVWSWSTGVGVCNRSEGRIGAGCSDSEHEVDTVNRDDLVVFYFNQTVEFEHLTVDPYDSQGSDPNDRDIIYWVGQVSSLPDFTQETFDTLESMVGLGAETMSSASSSYNPFTHALNGTGNILVLSGDYHDLNCKNKANQSSSCEAYKIANISVTAVPLPTTAWLFGSALLGLAGTSRRLKVIS